MPKKPTRRISPAMSRLVRDGIAERIAVRAGDEAVGLSADVARALVPIAASLRDRTRPRAGTGPGRDETTLALFAGADAPARSAAAGRLARELGLELLRVDLANVVSKYIGETEKALARIFDAAEASGAVLLIDEADALFGRRTEVKDSHDRYANLEVAYLLQRLERYPGLVIVALSDADRLDQAVRQRVAHVVTFPCPAAGT